MADLTITVANVVAGSNAKKKTVTAGETITAGEAVYSDPTAGGKYKLCQANVAGTADADGIALNGASNNQPLEIVYEDDDFTPGATVVVGTGYAVSAAAAGGIAPDTDLVSTNYKSMLFWGKTASTVKLLIVNTGAAIP